MVQDKQPTFLRECADIGGPFAAAMSIRSMAHWFEARSEVKPVFFAGSLATRGMVQYSMLTHGGRRYARL